MTHRAAAAAVAVLVAMGVAGCGVTSENRPQPITDASNQQAPATPSVDTEPGPTPSAPETSPTSTTRPPSQTSPAPVTDVRTDPARTPTSRAPAR